MFGKGESSTSRADQRSRRHCPLLNDCEIFPNQYGTTQFSVSIVSRNLVSGPLIARPLRAIHHHREWQDRCFYQPITGADSAVGGTQVPIQRVAQIAANELLAACACKSPILFGEDNTARDQINADRFRLAVWAQCNQQLHLHLRGRDGGLDFTRGRHDPLNTCTHCVQCGVRPQPASHCTHMPAKIACGSTTVVRDDDSLVDAVETRY